MTDCVANNSSDLAPVDSVVQSPSSPLSPFLSLPPIAINCGTKLNFLVYDFQQGLQSYLSVRVSNAKFLKIQLL